MNLTRLATTLALSVAVGVMLSAAPQSKGTSSTKAPEKAETQKAGKSADKAGKAGKAGALTAADLPKAVSDAVMKAHPGATISSVTKTMQGTDTVYVVKVSDAGKSSTMRLKEDGTMAMAAKKGKGK